MEELFNEFIKLSLNCLEYFEKNEELSEIDANDILSEFEIVHKKLITGDSKVYNFSDGQRREISNELVFKYPECLLNVNIIDIDSRNSNNEIEIDFHLKYLDEMIKYMKNEYDICELNDVEFDEFCVELIEMRVSFRMDIMNRLYNGFNEYSIRWKNRCVMVNGNEYRLMFDCMKSRLVEFKNNNESDRIEIIKNIVKEISLSSYDDEHYSVDDDDSDNYEYNIQSFKIMNLLNDFENYLKKPSQYIRNESINFRVINKLFESISIDIKHSIVYNYVLYYTSSLCFGSQIMDNTEYDEYIKE